MTKRCGKFLLQTMIVLAFMLMGATAAVAAFDDSRTHWARDAIDRWSANGVVKGYKGAFRPNDPVTRAEFAQMIDNVMGYTEKSGNPFIDVDAGKWYADALIELYAAGIIEGSSGHAFPERHISRQEAAVLIARAFRIADASEPASFTDQSEIARWAREAVTALAARKVVNGTPEGAFRPLASLTRAEAVKLFDNFIKTLISKPGVYAQDVTGNAVVNSAGVTLDNLDISGDLYIGPGVGEGEVTLNNVKIAGSVFVQGGGVNSIIFNSVNVGGTLVVDKSNGKVRILATGNTSVSVTTLASGALIVTRELTGGGFERIEIPADVAAGQEIVLEGEFATVVNRSESAQITANGTIKEFVAEAEARIVGEATIGTISGDKGASTTFNGQPVQPGAGTGSGTQEPAAGNEGGPAAGGPSTGGPAGGDSTPPPTVAVTGIDIDQGAAATVDWGTTKQLTATVSPSDATNKQVIWSVADSSTDVVTVSATGLVTATGVGTRTVQVKTQDGNKSDQITVTVPLTANAVFGIIEAAYLNDNADAYDIVSDLNLMASPTGIPGVAVSWSSDNTAALTDAGVVTRDEDSDGWVNLTAALSGSVTGSRTYELLVRSVLTEEVRTSAYVDSFFAEGYPQAYLKDGKIWTRFKLNAPAEVYMVVNAVHGTYSADVQAVLEGRAGNDNEILYVDRWPYFKIGAEDVGEVVDFDTGVSYVPGDARVEFVIRDAGTGYTSAAATTVKLTGTSDPGPDPDPWNDEYPPGTNSVWINEAMNVIYIYYPEPLDPTSVPATTDFALSAGTVVEVELDDLMQQDRLISSYVRLGVSGITADDLADLTLDYSGQALRDTSDARNEVGAFAAQPVKLAGERITSAVLGSDRTKMFVHIVSGWNNFEDPLVSLDTSRFAVLVGQETFKPSGILIGLFDVESLTFMLTFSAPLPDGDLSVAVDTQGMVNWVGDNYPEELATSEVEKIPEPGEPEAQYENGEIRLVFAEGFASDYSSYVGGFVLVADGVAYPLRGFIGRPDFSTSDAYNDYTIDLTDDSLQHLRTAIEASASVQIRYAVTHVDTHYFLSDAAGSLIPGFEAEVEVLPTR